MSLKEEIIIINAIPNTQAKIQMLGEQLFYFKKLNLPIMIVSGCHVPPYISEQVEYVIVNTDNEIIGTDYSRKMYDLGLHNLSYDYQKIDKYMCCFYWKTVNSTITKNIKLGFSAAKILGYKRAFYTEDDNIFKDKSFDYLNSNMDAIRNGKYKMAGWKGELGENFPMMCTAFFFADIEWLLENLTLPHMKDEWYDYDTTVKYHLHTPYEHVYYKLFEDKSDVFFDSIESYRELERSNTNKVFMDFGKMNRRFSEKNLINTFFTILPIENQNNAKMLLLSNTTQLYLPNGGIDYNIDIFYDESFHKNINLSSTSWCYEIIPNHIKNVKLNIHGFGEKMLSCDINDVKNNGHAINLLNT